MAHIKVVMATFQERFGFLTFGLAAAGRLPGFRMFKAMRTKTFLGRLLPF
jgi:hypothetical protein